MRPDVGLIQALLAPFALNLRALRALLAQNQLRLPRMADMGARRGAAPVAAWPVARARALGSLGLVLGLVAAGGMAAALIGSAAGELAMLGLLALLAVAGVFLIFGLLSGYPARERARGGGRDRQDDRRRARDRAPDRRRPRQRALSQPRPAAPHRAARRPARDARGAVRRRARLRASLLPPQPRRRARRASRRGVPRALAHRRGGRGRWLRVAVRPFPGTWRPGTAA